MTLGSLFDGIGGWQLAAIHNGVTPIWSSEIEPFPCAVTKKHFPDTIQLGDITKLHGAELPPVDIICAGSPCQDLSVAGKQEGLKGARSGLFMDAIKLVRDMRRASGGKSPRYFVWENVPGAFSSNKGMDFRAVLEEITEAEIPMLMAGSGQTPEWSNGMAARLPGECSTLNIGASPSVAEESFLSQILEAAPPEKYYLSARACEGILRRAERRGKDLPPELKAALVEQASCECALDALGVAKGL